MFAVDPIDSDSSWKNTQVVPILYPTSVKISVWDWLQGPFSILTRAYAFVTVFLTRQLEHRAKMRIKEGSVEKDRDRHWHGQCAGVRANNQGFV